MSWTDKVFGNFGWSKKSWLTILAGFVLGIVISIIIALIMVLFIPAVVKGDINPGLAIVGLVVAYIAFMPMAASALCAHWDDDCLAKSESVEDPVKPTS